LIERREYLPFVLIIGAVSISFAGPITSIINLPSVAIAFIRLSLSFIMLLPFFLRNIIRGEIPDRRLLEYSLVASAFLALHFLFWITSLKYTTVTSSVVLVTTNPLFVSIFSYLFIREKPKKGFIYAILLVLIGGIIISSQESISNKNLLGNGLALLGAVMASLYIITGRKVRQTYSLTNYTSTLYFFTSIILFGVCIFTRTDITGYDSSSYLLILFLALVPQLLGHNAFNWALKYTSPTFISILILFEPIGATIISYLLFGYIPSIFEIIGSILILIGIIVSIIIRT